MHFDEMINKITALLQECNTSNLTPADIGQITALITSFCTETSSAKCKQGFKVLTGLENPIYAGLVSILMVNRPNHFLDYREIEALSLGVAKLLAQRPKDRLKLTLATASAFRGGNDES